MNVECGGLGALPSGATLRPRDIMEPQHVVIRVNGELHPRQSKLYLPNHPVLRQHKEWIGVPRAPLLLGKPKNLTEIGNILPSYPANGTNMDTSTAFSKARLHMATTDAVDYI